MMQQLFSKQLSPFSNNVAFNIFVWEIFWSKHVLVPITANVMRSFLDIQKGWLFVKIIKKRVSLKIELCPLFLEKIMTGF